MSDSKQKPSTPTKPGIKVNPVKDLEPDESQSESVRGGTIGAGIRGLVFSDAALKRQVTPLTSALTKLREL